MLITVDELQLSLPSIMCQSLQANQSHREGKTRPFPNCWRKSQLDGIMMQKTEIFLIFTNINFVLSPWIRSSMGIDGKCIGKVVFPMVGNLDS